jgi:SSS family solute:Na+ symporter
MKFGILNSFQRLDWFIFFLILVFTILMVFINEYKHKGEHSIIDTLLMGRKLTLLPFIATLVATWYGGIFGTAQIAFDAGIYNFITQGLFWYFTYFIFAKYILPKIKKNEVASLPELVGTLIGPKSQKISALFNILNLIPIVYAISLGLIIQMIFHTSFPISVFIGVFIVSLYSAGGGLRAVVISDIIQFFVMFSSVVILFLFCLLHFGTKPFTFLEPYYFSPLSKYGLTETIVWGFLALATLVDPNFYQRSYAAINTKTAKVGIYFSIIVWIIFDISLTFGAMYAKALLPLADSSSGYFEFAFKVLPQGMKGYFLAGILATVMSTLDSYLFLSSSTIVYDLFPKFKNSRYSFVLSFIIIGAFSCVMAISFEGNIKEVWKAMGSLSSAALLVPLIFNLFNKIKMTDNMFLTTTISSAIMVLAWRLSPLKNITQIDELYPGILISIIFCLNHHFRTRRKI